MLFFTGISIQESSNGILVAAATWHSTLLPRFSTRQMSLEYAKENLSALVRVCNPLLIPAVNAACHRTIEQILIRHKFRTKQPPAITLIIRPAHARNTYLVPHIKKQSHWLLSAADNALSTWNKGYK